MYFKRLHKLHKSEKATHMKSYNTYVCLFTGTHMIKKPLVKKFLETHLKVEICALRKSIDYKRSATKIIMRTKEPMSWVN